MRWKALYCTLYCNYHALEALKMRPYRQFVMSNDCLWTMSYETMLCCKYLEFDSECEHQ